MPGIIAERGRRGRRACRVRAVPLVAALLVVLTTAARGEWTETGLAVCTNEYNQQYPSIASDGAGGMIVAWNDWRGASRDIYAQRIDASGTLLWSSGGVPVCTVEGSQQFPLVVADGTGGAIVAWIDNRSGSGNENIDLYVQRIDANGNRCWGERAVVLSGAPNAAMNLLGVADGAGGAIFAWSDYRDYTATQIDVYAQRVDSDGVCRWAPDGIPVCAFPGYLAPMGIAPDGAGGATISWCDQRTGPYGTCIQHVEWDGAIRFPANGVKLFDLAADECARIAPFAGDTIAAFVTHIEVAGMTLLAQLVDGDGLGVWSSEVTVAEPSDVFGPAIVKTGGDLVVAWSATGSGGYDIFAQRLGPDGALLWPAGGVSVCAAPGDQKDFLFLSPDGEGGVVLAWRDKRENHLDFYAQRIGSDGAPRWATDGIPVSTTDCEMEYPCAVSDGAGGLFAAWHAFAGLYSDVFAARVHANGELTAVLLAGFDVSRRGDAVLLEWTLAVPEPAAAFAVSRSSGTEFRALPAGGLTGDGRRFTYVDDEVTPGTTCRWRVESIEAGERRVLFETAPLPIPAAPLALHQNRPNPFNPSTTIVFDLPARAEARLAVYDAAGRLVRRLAAGDLSPGRHELRWDGLDDAGRPAASGVYFCRLRAGKETRSIRLVLLR